MICLIKGQCAFMNDVYVMGGKINNSPKNDLDHLYDYRIDSCYSFDTKELKWKGVSNIPGRRSLAASAVFEGNIVVCGGTNPALDRMNSVESYDVFSNAWTPMPNMIESRRHHNLVCVKSKLFVIRGFNSESCELYDGACKKFTLLKSPTFTRHNLSAVLIRNRIFLFQRRSKCILSYNVDEEKWSEESFEPLQDSCSYSCAKVPIY